MNRAPLLLRVIRDALRDRLTFTVEAAPRPVKLARELRAELPGCVIAVVPGGVKVSRAAGSCPLMVRAPWGEVRACSLVEWHAGRCEGLSGEILTVVEIPPESRRVLTEAAFKSARK